MPSELDLLLLYVSLIPQINQNGIFVIGERKDYEVLIGIHAPYGLVIAVQAVSVRLFASQVPFNQLSVLTCR